MEDINKICPAQIDSSLSPSNKQHERWCIWYEPLYDFEKVHFNVWKTWSARNLFPVTFLSFEMSTCAGCLLKLVHAEEHSKGSFSTMKHNNARCSLMVDAKAMQTISRAFRRAFVLVHVSHWSWDVHVLTHIHWQTKAHAYCGAIYWIFSNHHPDAYFLGIRVHLSGTY